VDSTPRHADLAQVGPFLGVSSLCSETISNNCFFLLVAGATRFD
jgi:hypothetical protein